MHTFVNQVPKKQIIQVRNIHIFFSYFLAPRMSELLLTEIEVGRVKWFLGE